jgi:hypothetical protein
VFEQEKSSGHKEDEFKYLQRRRGVGIGLRREVRKEEKLKEQSNAEGSEVWKIRRVLPCQVKQVEVGCRL